MRSRKRCWAACVLLAGWVGACAGEDSTAQPGADVAAPGAALPGVQAPGGTAAPPGGDPAGSTQPAPVAGEAPGGSPAAPPPAEGGDPAQPPPADGGSAGAAAPPSGQSPPPAQGSDCLPPSDDFTDAGPLTPAMMDVDLGGAVGMFTVFHPAEMRDGCSYPIVAWGNGTGVTGPVIYSHFNNHAASWGLVVIAAHDSNVGNGAFHQAGIDWLLAQNADPGSPFFGKLSTRAGVTGHSQGGIGASVASSHPNVEVEVCVQGGGVPSAGVATLCLTGTDDFMNAMCSGTYAAATGPAFLADYTGADHIATPTFPLGAATPAGIEYVRLHTAWLRCFLADDAGACSLFNNPCTACSDPGWARIESRNM